MKRKGLIGALCGLAFTCIISGVSVLSPAKAENGEVAPETIQLQSGAEIRIPTQGNSASGMRFTLRVNKEWYDSENPEVGMFIAKTEDLTDDKNLTSQDGIDAVTDKDGGIGYLQVKMQPDREYKTAEIGGAECYLFKVVLNLGVDNYMKEFTANGYYHAEGENAIYNATPVSRSVAYIADRAYNAGVQNETVLGFINGALTEENFCAPSNVTTDMYKQTELESFVLPEKLTVAWENTHPEVAAINETTGKITKVGVGETEITATIGTTTRKTVVTVKEPIAVSVTEETKKDYFNPDIPSGFVSAADLKNEGFAGDYAGNATKMYIASNSNYRIKNNYTASELAEIAKRYSTVSLWVAVNGVKEGGKAYFTQADGKNFIGKAFGKDRGFTSAENGKWTKLSISMQAYINLLAENNYTHCPLASIWVESAVANEGEWAYAYCGDLTFAAPSAQFKIIDVETTPKSYAFYDGYSYSYTNAPESVPGLTGDYSGAVTAIKFEQKKPWYVKNPFANAAEFAEYSAYYNTVSFYVGYIHDGDGYKTVYPSQTVGQDAQDDPTALLYYTQEKMLTLEDGKWVKVSVTMADFAKWLEENNYANLCKIGANRYTSKSPMIYFGDMYFENV